MWGVFSCLCFLSCYMEIKINLVLVMLVDLTENKNKMLSLSLSRGFMLFKESYWSKMQKMSCLKQNAKIMCQGRVRTTEKTAGTSQEFWTKLPLGRRVPELWCSQHWSWKGQKYWDGWLCPPLGCLSGWPWNHLYVVNLKNMCVQSMHRYWKLIPNSKIQGQGTMEILE